MNQRAFFSPSVQVIGLMLMALLAWDSSGLDMPMAQLFGAADGFPWRDKPLLTTVLHDGAKFTSWLLVVLLCVAIWWPMGWLCRIPSERRLQLVVSGLLSVLVVTVMKSLNSASCPWDLSAFGGVAHYISHWAIGVHDGGSGRCFPAGHATAGFAFVGGWFAFKRDAPQIASRWLALAVWVGFVLGLAQQARGAHFMSHTLWTGWLCWTVAWVVDLAWTRYVPAQVAI